MKIIADDQIPLVAHYFGHCGEIILKPGRAISRADLINADILLVRSVTLVDKSLLKNTSVRFIGSPVSGLDHINIHWLDTQAIQWANASGCNADAVTEYIACVIAALKKLKLLPATNIRAGVVGIGEIGSRVVNLLKSFQFEVMQCDPLRAEKELDFISTPIEDFSELDLMTFHIPLTQTGSYPTDHLINKDFLKKQKPNCFLINTSRGAILNSADFKQYGQHLNGCLDVWENEPVIDPALLNNTLIATPHIAGYSIQSKYRGIKKIYQQACHQKIISPSPLLLEPVYPMRKIFFQDPASWEDILLTIFDPLYLTQEFKKIPPNQLANQFDLLRKKFQNRDEFKYITIAYSTMHPQDQLVLEKLGLNCILIK